MQLSVLTSSITEPVLKADVKAFMGFPSADTSQDSTIDAMITAARQFLEAKTGLSIVSKSYKAYFEEEDAEDGWYDLPVSPVLAAPAITVTMNGVSTTFQQVGMTRVRIMPDSVFGTLTVGSSSSPSYVEVTFQAGATNGIANLCLLKIVSEMFNHREDGISVNIARLPFDTVSLINSLTVNF
jgi:uncharacterized phiE125 gp8 family phage protein